MAARNGPATEVLLNMLEKLGLKQFYPNKLTLRSLLEINKDNVCDRTVSSLEDIPWCFLRKLFKFSAECRSKTQLPINDEDTDDFFDFDSFTKDDSDKKIHPLDLIVALFLCADSFLLQEMALKMSMCQFSVPLLLPHGNRGQCGLVIWSLRDIVKEWCLHAISDSKGFVEDSIVQADMPFYSFVRLKNCSLSKSQLLNHVLSRGQQNQNIFIHRDMEGGAVKREIADGLAEVCWYLPCGRENLDIFPEPVAFANLRGDIFGSLAQFHLLFQVSTATFVFMDKVEEDELEILTSLQDVSSKLFLVVNRKEGRAKEDMMSVKTAIEKLDLPKSNVKTTDSKVNGAEFAKKLCAVIKNSLPSVTSVNIASMVEKAVELGLSVDESMIDEQKKAAEDIMKGIKVETIPDYKKQQLPLQGKNWERLSQLEKEMCRLKDSGHSGLEEYKSQLQEEQKRIKEEQNKFKTSEALKSFISHLSTNDRQERDFFHKWMKLKLDAYSRDKLSALRNQFKEQCRNKDAKRIAELDQALLESSLGIEHFMREMGLIYEFSSQSNDTSGEISRLPGLAAEMLLHGHPLELLDGDVSNIPERWVSDVLMELHQKVGGRSRLLVLTVLGVQSSGKSTLLNTMFGVQFPVSSGRCTRGAYMVFLRVGEELKNELKYDFILLIDTEGLKSPDLAQLDDSYEHDNQLATFVIGLSDVTIINIAMENFTEMKDVLQIATHAFLRMKEIGKKPVCYFVHQNVGGVSAHSKCLTDRKHLLDQLNQMTEIAAEMEKQPSIKAFTDVLDYDIEKNNWNIPGLWYGTPPMAPVNTGYSEAVADFKNHLLEMAKRDSGNKAKAIPDFLEWMKSLWKAVKYENFIFSFRNTLVAHAYDNLCKDFSQWEWEFRKEILSWQKDAELEILNADSESEGESWQTLIETKRAEVFGKITSQQKIMRGKLFNYYQSKDRHVDLLRKYKVDFVNSIKSLGEEIQHDVKTKLDCILELKKSTKKAQDIQRKYRTVIEEQVIKLLSDCKGSTLSDGELRQEFERMWTLATANLSGLKERDISGCVREQLRKNFSNLNVTEELQSINLEEAGTVPLKVKRDHVHSIMRKIKYWLNGELKTNTDSLIESCIRFVQDKVQANEDYHDSLTRDLLVKIDKFLKQSSKKYETNTKFEIDLKLHVCGIATREFMKMHKRFLANIDPRTQLENYKSQYWEDFLDLYKKRDHCQRKAEDFVQVCIKPAVEDYINRSLGIDIVDEVLTSRHSAEYSSRSFFQFNIQKALLEKDNFDRFFKYISKYEIYVKHRIFRHIVRKMSEEKTLLKLKNKNLQVIFEKITDALEAASKGKDGDLLPDNRDSITELISQLRKHLIKDISISLESEKMTLFQIQSTCHPFINCLKKSTEDLKKQLQKEFSVSEDISKTLKELPVKPQDELFKRVFGCGKQCPFCKVPCEAGGKEHKVHYAAIHRPQGLGGYKHQKSEKLVETLCTTDIQSEKKFSNTDTKEELQPYKDYAKYYPDWNIPPDNTIEASNYWKYVLVKYNDRFPEKYEAKPADVPQAWMNITQEQALKGLKEAFNIK